MKSRKRKIILIVVILLLLLFFLLYFVWSNRQSYKSVQYSILYHSDTLVKTKDLERYLAKCCNPIAGELKRNVSLPQIEAQIRRWPYCDSVRTFTDIHGNVRIEMVQAKVVARVINAGGESFYLAVSSCRFFPIVRCVCWWSAETFRTAIVPTITWNCMTPPFVAIC